MSHRKFVGPAVALALGLACTAALAQDAATTTTTTTTKHTESTGLAKHGKTAAKTTAAPKVDINTATKEQLESLPGIGDAIADKIIADRPFANKHQLLDKGLVNKAQYAKMSPHIIASHASTMGAAHASAHTAMPGASNASTTRSHTRTKHTATDTPTTSGH